VRDRLAEELETIIRGSGWFMAVLEAGRDVNPADWWIGAGALRDLVWDGLHGGFEPGMVRDVDLAFFDATDLSSAAESALEHRLCERLPGVPWEAKNQAAVHTWYARRFGFEVEPLRSAAEGVSTWPETATAVGVRLLGNEEMELTAWWGLADLLQGVCRRNPRRVSVEEFKRRIEAKNVRTRWPRVRVISD
jgi:hypothetical protein